MMKRIGSALLMCAWLLLCGAARAQTVPSNAAFSPGLMKWAALEGTKPPVSAEASVKLDKALYARDLSVLAAMLKGTTFIYHGGEAGETLSICRDGETLGLYALPQSEALDGLSSALLGKAVLECVPLQTLAAWLEGLAPGDALGFGFAVSEPFTLVRTMSDDGTRLTKIVLSGAVARGEEAPYRIEGFLRQPAGRAPKDTFELTFTRDADNFIELSYSALRENEVTRKDREGTVSVRTSLKAAGKLAGSGLSGRLSVTMKNRWKADGDALSERITITTGLTWEDRTPGRRMQRLNSIEAEARHTLSLTTHESGDETLSLAHGMELEITLDETPFLAGSAEMTLQLGEGETPVRGEEAAEALTPETLTAEAVKALAARLYKQLDPDTRAAIGKGL